MRIANFGGFLDLSGCCDVIRIPAIQKRLQVADADKMFCIEMFVDSVALTGLCHQKYSGVVAIVKIHPGFGANQKLELIASRNWFLP